MNQRLIHDTAVSMAHALLDFVTPCIREEEKLDAFTEFYVVCKAGIEAFCIEQDGMLHRPYSTKN